MKKEFKSSIVWLRRDLRLHDHKALSEATRISEKVYLVFVFDEKILKGLPEKDKRVSFIWEILESLPVLKVYGDPVDLIPELAKELEVEAVFCNRDYESRALKRDVEVYKKLKTQEIYFFQLKDQVIFEKQEVLNLKNEMYKVFTPYKNSWLQKLEEKKIEVVGEKKVNQDKIEAPPKKTKTVKDLSDIGFQYEKTEIEEASKLKKSLLKKIDSYKNARDIPSIDGTSRLSVHLRFGTISVRELVRICLENDSVGAKTFLSELCWRDFYFAILCHFPQVESGCYNEKYDKLKFVKDKKLFDAWCAGKTGFPLVDAAMRQLNETGWMHNRLRMLTASFLTKTMLLDWKLGEKYFAQKLIDFDFSANNGGWQWSVSTGVDAAPYFRIFNPTSQMEKFDPDGVFVRKFCPELEGLSMKEIKNMSDDVRRELNYPEEVVNYKSNRIKALAMYKKCDGDS